MFYDKKIFNSYAYSFPNKEILLHGNGLNFYDIKNLEKSVYVNNLTLEKQKDVETLFKGIGVFEDLEIFREYRNLDDNFRINFNLNLFYFQF